MFRLIRAILGATFVAGGLALAAIGASAAATSSTTLSITVPGTITLSGLAANYNQTIPAGQSGQIPTAITVTTNNNAGLTVNIKASGGAFQGATAGMVNSADHVAVDACPSGASCATGDLNNTAGTDVVATHNASAGTSFSVIHTISVPPTQAGDLYVGTIVYTATAN